MHRVRCGAKIQAKKIMLQRSSTFQTPDYEVSSMINEIDSKELKEKLDRGENIILIDCREQEEWDDGHIAAAKLIPLSEFEQRYAEVGPTDAQIIVQCRSGKRSLNACMILQNNGYENLTNLAGGILGWAEHGYEVV